MTKTCFAFSDTYLRLWNRQKWEAFGAFRITAVLEEAECRNSRVGLADVVQEAGLGLRFAQLRPKNLTNYIYYILKSGWFEAHRS